MHGPKFRETFLFLVNNTIAPNLNIDTLVARSSVSYDTNTRWSVLLSSGWLAQDVTVKKSACPLQLDMAITLFIRWHKFCSSATFVCGNTNSVLSWPTIASYFFMLKLPSSSCNVLKFDAGRCTLGLLKYGEFLLMPYRFDSHSKFAIVFIVAKHKSGSCSCWN